MTNQEESTKRTSLSDLLRPKGSSVATESLGPVTVYPPTVKVVAALEEQFGEQLDREPADAVFVAYLGLAASSSPEAKQDERGLSTEDLGKLTPADKTALALIALGELGDTLVNESDPVQGFISRLALQGERIRRNRRQLQEKLKSIGLGFDSASKRMLDESLRHSELIKRSLGPLGTLSSMSPAFDISKLSKTPQWKMLDRIQKAAAPLASLPTYSEDLVREGDMKTLRAPLDPGKPTREHQARLEVAGERVIELANVAVLRINELADFAQTFQVEAAESGKKNIRIAMFALIVGASLSLLQLSYQVVKDIFDGPKSKEQMKLLRENNAAATQEIALVHQMLDEARRERETLTQGLSAIAKPAVSAPKTDASEDRIRPAADPRRRGELPTGHPSLTTSARRFTADMP